MSGLDQYKKNKWREELVYLQRENQTGFKVIYPKVLTTYIHLDATCECTNPTYWY